jgi:hypothetical protein
MGTCVKLNKLELLKWMRKQGVWMAFCAANVAAREGHIEILAWLWKHYRHIVDFNEATCASAASEGRLDVLKWLRRRYVPWNEDTSQAAFWHVQRTGDWAVFNWAMRHGCRGTEETCTDAAEMGLDALKVVRKFNIPVSQDAMEVAHAQGDEEMIDYLLGCGLALIDED